MIQKIGYPAVLLAFSFAACCLTSFPISAEENMMISGNDAGFGAKYAKQMVGKDLDNWSCPEDYIKCRKSKVLEFREFRYIAMEFSERLPEGLITYQIMASVDGQRIAEAEARAEFQGKEFSNFKRPIHWSYFSNRKEYGQAILGTPGLYGMNRSKAEALLSNSGLLWHREAVTEDGIVIQYFVPLFKKGGMPDRAGANYNQNRPWIAEFVLKVDTVSRFATKPSGWADEALLMRQAREHWESGE